MKTGDRIFFALQAMVKYIAFGFGVRLRRLVYRPFFRSMGAKVQIKDGTTFKYPSEIDLGDYCTIGENCYLVGKGGLRIGDNLLMGAGSKIVTSTHNFARRDVSIREQGLSFSGITIGADVWLGFDVIVLGGSTIARGCIVGAGSLVNKQFTEPYQILIGSPARVEKSRP